MGGHGNGLYSTGSDYSELSSTEDGIFKGLGLSTDICAALTANTGGVHLFHTRLATVGGKTNANSHPFRCGEEGVLVHNGGFVDYDLYAVSEDALTDTAGAARLIETYGEGVLFSDTFKDSGVWVLVDRERGFPLVVNRGQHQIYSIMLRDGGWLVASETPRNTSPLRYVSSTALAKDNAYEIVPSTGVPALANDVTEPVHLTPDYQPWYVSKPSATGGYPDEYDFEDKGTNIYASGLIKSHGYYYCRCTLCGVWDCVQPNVDPDIHECAPCEDWLLAKLAEEEDDAWEQQRQLEAAREE